MKVKSFIDSFDRSDEHDAEAIGVYEAFMTGKCDACEYEKDCANPDNEDFDFPPDAWCIKRGKEILDDWRN